MIARKDLRIEIRGGTVVVTMVPSTAATILIAFGFMFGPGRDVPNAWRRALWMALLFSAVMASRRAYQVETEDGALEGLLLALIDKATVFLGKTAAVALELLVLTIAILFLVVPCSTSRSPTRTGGARLRARRHRARDGREPLRRRGRVRSDARGDLPGCSSCPS